MMASENAGNEEETGPAAESNEHDYAHSADSTTTEPQQGASMQILSEELPEPAVGAEVDCPTAGGNEVEIQIPVEPDPCSDYDFTASVSPAMSSRGPRRLPRRPEDRNCSCCKLLFQRQGRSFNRRAVFTFTTPETVQWVFPDSVVNDKSFLCENCAQIIRTKGKRKQSGKRTLWLKPPISKEVKDRRALGPRMGKKSKAALLISKSCYKAAFQTLWSAKGARKPMMAFWSKQLKSEMKALSRQTDSPFQQKVSGRKPMSSFPWRRCLNWAQEKAPLVIACLRSMFPDINALYKSSHQLTEEQAITLLERRTVVALSIPLFTRNIWRNNFLQAALGAELRQQGCSGSALDTLNTMGLCQNKDTVRLLIHRLKNGKDVDGERQLKEQMGKMMADAEEEEDEDEEEEEEDVDEEEDESEDVEEMVMAMKEDEPVEQEEVQDILEEDEVEPAVIEKEEKKKKKKKAKKQRKEEKRKEKGKRKVKEEQDDDEDGSEQKKRKVVVVRLGLLKGTSEVGRSDLSAP